MTRWIIFPLMLLASAEDIFTRRVENKLMLVLATVVLADLLAGVLGGQFAAIADRIAASLLVLISFTAVGVSSGGVGGADIKAASLLALHAGLLRSTIFIPFSLLLMLFYRALCRFRKISVSSAPYVPFLTVAYITVLQLLHCG